MLLKVTVCYMLHSDAQWLLFAPLTNEVQAAFPSFVAPDAELAFLKLEHPQADLSLYAVIASFCLAWC